MYQEIYCVGNKAKRGISNRRQQENKARQIFRKKNGHFLSPDTHTYVCVSWGNKYLFFGKFGVLCFLVTSVWRLALLPYYQRVMRITPCTCNIKIIFKSLLLARKEVICYSYMLFGFTLFVWIKKLVS